jgi:hypothetical protein
MNTQKQSWVIKITVALSLIVLLVAGCAQQSLAPPVPQTYSPVPKTVEVAQLRDDYAASTDLADTLYVGKRVHLRNLTVTAVWRGFVAYYAIVDNMWFKVTYTFYLDTVGVDTIIDVTGVCSGCTNGRIYFDDCWIGVVGGATATRSGY